MDPAGEGTGQFHGMKLKTWTLKTAKPGTPEFRVALLNAFETMGRTVVAHGTLNWTKDDHWGYTPDTGVIYQVQNGDWKFVQ